MDELLGKGFEWLLTQGVLGLTTVIGAALALALFRARERDRLEHADKLQAREVAHDAEISSWIKLYIDVQAERLSDQKLQNEKLASAHDLVRSLYEAGRGSYVKAS
jgi:hypothetical protein